MTPTPTQRERLNSIRQKKADKRDERKAAREQLNTATERFTADPSRENMQEVTRLQNRVGNLADEIEALSVQDLGSLREIDGRSAFGSMGFLADPETVDSLERFAGSSAPIGRVNLGELLSRNEAVDLTGRMMAVAGQVTPTEQMQTGPHAGIVTQLQSPLSFLDLTIWMSVRPALAVEGGRFPHGGRGGDVRSRGGNRATVHNRRGGASHGEG